MPAEGEVDQTNGKAICLVPDTNLWINRRTLLLNTSYANSLLYALRMHGGSIGLPEVVYEELKRLVPELAKQATNNLKDAARDIVELAGTPDAWPIRETPTDLSRALGDRLERLRPMLMEIPFAEDHGRRALNRVLDKLPPNGPKNQQFKDSAIWEAIKDLAKGYQVWFVTGDNGFFEDRDKTKGLSLSLAEELAANEWVVRLIHTDDLDDVLEELQGGMSRPSSVVAIEDLEELVRVYAERSATEHVGRLGHFTGAGMRVFTTGEKGELVVSFLISFEIRSLLEDGGRGDLVLSGTADYSEDTEQLSGVRIASEEIHWPAKNTTIRIGHGLYAGLPGIAVE